MMGIIPRKNFTSAGLRPSAAAVARTAEVYFLVEAMVGLAQKIASACLPPNAMPDLELPAWKRTVWMSVLFPNTSLWRDAKRFFWRAHVVPGVRCGEGCV